METILLELQDIFNHIHLHVYGVEYNFSNSRIKKSLNKFLTTIPKGVGEDWFFNYTIFQFAYYSNLKTHCSRVYLNWVYGPKALERWENRTEQQLFYSNQFKLQFKLSLPLKTLNSRSYFILERSRFQKKERQLLHCNELSLFSDDQICKSCYYYDKCKSVY